MLWFLFLSSLLHAQTTPKIEKIVGVFYFKPMFGHVHEAPFKTSLSLTTIQCSHPLKVIESTKVKVSEDWSYVQVADYKGFVLKQFLSKKRPRCFQGEYPKFFDGFNLDLSDLYYWGRLNDHLIIGETRVK